MKIISLVGAVLAVLLIGASAVMAAAPDAFSLLPATDVLLRDAIGAMAMMGAPAAAAPHALLNPYGRGLARARADAGSAQELFAELKTTIEQFKAAHSEELKGIQSRFDDVVTREKVDRINDQITTLNNALNDVNQMLAAAAIGAAGGINHDPDVVAHSDAFNRWFRKGVEGDLSDLEVKAKLTTQSDPDGGYLVPTETENTIDRVLGKVSTIRSLSRVISISTDVYKKLVSVGGTTSGWVGEEDERPVTAASKLREIAINTAEIYAQPASTQTALDDARIDIGGWIADEVSIEFAEQEGLAFVSGNGVKKPRGFLSYDTVANGSHAWGKIGYVASGDASGFVSPTTSANPADALIDLYYALKQGYRANAAWLMSDATMSKIRKFKDAEGNYIWAGPSQAAEIATILGKPVHTDDNMPSVASNAFPIAFGDFRRGYLIADRVGIRVLRDPYTQKPHVLFYTTKRVGGGVVDFDAIKLLKAATS